MVTKKQKTTKTNKTTVAKPEQSPVTAPAAPDVHPVGSPKPVAAHSGMPQTKISRPAIILGATAATIITLLLVAIDAWAEYHSTSYSATEVTVTQPDLLVALLLIGIALAIILLPGFIVALIVLPMLRKKK